MKYPSSLDRNNSGNVVKLLKPAFRYGNYFQKKKKESPPTRVLTFESSREPGKAGRTGRLSRKGLDHWTQDRSTISALPISHDLEDVVGVSNANLERDTLGTMQTEDGEDEPGPKQPT